MFSDDKQHKAEGKHKRGQTQTTQQLNYLDLQKQKTVVWNQCNCISAIFASITYLLYFKVNNTMQDYMTKISLYANYWPESSPLLSIVFSVMAVWSIKKDWPRSHDIPAIPSVIHHDSWVTYNPLTKIPHHLCYPLCSLSWLFAVLHRSHWCCSHKWYTEGCQLFWHQLSCTHCKKIRETA